MPLVKLKEYVKEWDELPSNSSHKLDWLTDRTSRTTMSAIIRALDLHPVAARRVQMAFYIYEFPEEMLAIEYNDHDKVLHESVKVGIATLRQVLDKEDGTHTEVVGMIADLSNAFQVWRESKSALSDAKKALLCLHMEKQNGASNEEKARGVIAIALKARCMTEEEGWKIYREGIEGITTGDGEEVET